MARISARKETRILASSAESGSSSRSTCGSIRQGTRQGNALLLSARELTGEAVALLLKMNQRQHFVHTLFDGRFGFPVDLHAKADVLSNGHVWEEGVGLKDHAHIALVGSFVGDIRIIEDHLARGRSFKAGDHAQGGRFAATRRAKKGNELTLLHVQIEIMNHAVVAKTVWRCW